jgi:TRAP-type C4-dicarboxylate transport system substrate-binding protein
MWRTSTRWTGLLLIVIVSVIGAGAGARAADKVVLKLGTLAPDGSSWHQSLKEMAAEWKKASNGTVELKIYAGGVAGNEGDMARKLRIGQLHAAAISVVGLGDIHTAPQAIASPGLIADEAEWEHVFWRATALWEPQFLAKGYLVLMWGDTGFVHMFLKRSVQRPSEMAGMKVFAWAGDPSSTEAFKLAGFQPVVMSSTDILPALSTGMIESFAATPVMALGARWYEQTPYMTTAAWGHLPAATVVSLKAWERIPEPTRQRLLEIARAYAAKAYAASKKGQADAIAAMQKNGLKLIEYDAAGMAEWQQISERTWSIIRGGVVRPEDFDAVKRIRDEYRARPPAAP